MRWCRSSLPRRSTPRSAANSPQSASSRARRSMPDARMRKILTDAIAIANGASAHRQFPRRASQRGSATTVRSRSGSTRCSSAAITSPDASAEITKEGVKPFPYTGARTLDARAAFFYVATGVTPAMVMRLTNVGSQYLFGILDASGEPFDGGKTYKVTLPPNIPAAKFWSFTLYDNQTRSMLQTAAAIPSRRQPELSRARRPRRTLTDRPPSISGRANPRACRTATGSRPCRTRAGS